MIPTAVQELIDKAKARQQVADACDHRFDPSANGTSVCRDCGERITTPEAPPILVWSCDFCGELTTGGITQLSKSHGIAGNCRFCGQLVPATLKTVPVSAPSLGGDRLEVSQDA